MISLPSLPEKIRRFIRGLTPDEPFLVEREARYSGTIPRATKYWCIIALALNAAVSVVATIAMLNVAPVLIASLASLFPAYMLLFWRDLTSTHDDVANKLDGIKFPRYSQVWNGSGSVSPSCPAFFDHRNGGGRLPSATVKRGFDSMLHCNSCRAGRL